MSNTTSTAKVDEWAAATGCSTEETAAAWQDLLRRGLAQEDAGQLMLSPLAMRRAASATQRRLTAHLAGYLLTENSFIVRRTGDALGLPCILNTRIAVEHVA